MPAPLAALTLARALLRPQPDACADAPPARVEKAGPAESKVFLVEQYLPHLSPPLLESLARRLSAVADELRREGADVRLLGSAGLPGDDALLSVVAAPSVDAAARAVERAGLAVDRIVPVLWRQGHAADPAQFRSVSKRRT